MKQCIVNALLIFSFLVGFVASESAEKNNGHCQGMNFQKDVDMEQIDQISKYIDKQSCVPLGNYSEVIYTAQWNAPNRCNAFEALICGTLVFSFLGPLQYGVINILTAACTENGTLMKALSANAFLHILGTWFGSEIITHNEGDKEGIFYYNSCVRIHISNITSQMRNSDLNWQDYTTYFRPDDHSNRRFSFLKLIWEENDTVLEYTIRYEHSRRGLWISSGPQSGDLVNLQFEHFRGTIQVMKAVSNHLVLTFCNTTPGSKLFSITLSRKPETLPEEDLESVRKLLRRRGLSTSHIRKVCSSGNIIQQISSLLLLFLAIIISKGL